MSKRKEIAWLTAVLAATLIWSGGCPARKPAPPTAPAPTPPGTITTPAPTPTPPRTEGPRTQAQARDAADDIADAVSRIDGVNKASVVVVGNVALIGLDLKAGIEGTKVEAIREKAATTAKRDPRIVNAVVETDPDAVGRIKKIAAGVRQGRPISEFFDQISEFFKRLKPTS
ncbi:MAG: YhcN/YlaJ family sporulation lipoprotein [Bacillota bacterium]|uniref:YhcN/YlaJ family sporulation lipoprotein n=1 Tax=Carboxydocella sp. ULO1 TaxID=1926599 RepID=UPI0009ACF612|nr:YhcN/YlaJ family sporulation lipoprotein [Carboxydocella sp. ULO1]GAW29800.1 sporulation lipoprotein, YhcN/YlaJ family [Carboxydocella sp. ULO1]